MESLHADVWQLPGPDLRLPGGAVLPLRSTLVRLPDRALLVYSPVAFDDATAAEIDALGEVAHIVAPNLAHHLHAPAAAARWPRATVHAARGVEAKQPGLRIDRWLPERDASWGDALDLELVGGAPRIGETVLFHRPSGTLICADFLFHVTEPANLRTRALLAMLGTGGQRLAQSRVWRMVRADRAAARASVDRILAWPIARVATCHGSPCAIDAAALATRVTRLYGGSVSGASDRSAAGSLT
ncbi:MAG TPA: DUF4336 domain-containing protein [Kofleriaceae bacterium]|nr:DUF4336 domain-containing protein [Kofleriaceae bacterium]